MFYLFHANLRLLLHSCFLLSLLLLLFLVLSEVSLPVAEGGFCLALPLFGSHMTKEWHIVLTLKGVKTGACVW